MYLAHMLCCNANRWAALITQLTNAQQNCLPVLDVPEIQYVCVGVPRFDGYLERFVGVSKPHFPQQKLYLQVFETTT